MNAPGFVLVGGGARSGKSAFALRLARERGARRGFIATAQAFDGEMRRKIESHVAERGTDFDTIESPDDVVGALDAFAARRPNVDVVVLDCLTLWLTNLLLRELPATAIEEHVRQLCAALVAAPFQSIVVTNEVGLGLVPETPLGRAFRDVAGFAHQELARGARELYLAALGTLLRLRPAPVSEVPSWSAR